jgi:hypothetical protein
MRRWTLSLLFLATVNVAQGQQPGIDFFEKKIRPVLVEHCYSCHSADAKKVKGELLLDTREGIRKGGEGGPAVVPGDVKAGLLLKALRHDELKMPPKGPLPKEVVADFEAWIKMGAPDPRDGKAKLAKREIDLEEGRRYWAFQPLKPTVPPAVKLDAWVKTPVDRFILAKLEAKQLAPNPVTSREKLIRRATFDLTGLPPTPAEIDAFVGDASPDAYGKLVDRLLASPHYGERWGRHWLDVVRYAESGGYEFDGDRPGAFHYRDFVIKALNQGMPFDEFVRLQIAGDLLKPGDFFATTATGLLVDGPYPGQITAKTRERIRYDHLDDMASTLGSALLGLSIGCVRCHEHKYDPIPHIDYYRLLAGLARVDSTRPKLDPNPEVYKKAKADYDAAHAPLVKALEQYHQSELAAKVQTWAAAERAKPAPVWLTLDAVTATGKGALKKLDDGSLLAGKGVNNDTYTVVAHTQHKGITSLRLEAIADPTLPGQGPGYAADGNFVLSDVTVTATPLVGKGKAVPVKLKAIRASHEGKGQPLSNAIDADKKSGWSVAGQAGKSHAAVFETEGEIGFDGGAILTFTLKFDTAANALGRLRLGVATARAAALDAAAQPQAGREVLALLTESKGMIDDKTREPISRWFRAFDPALEKLRSAVEESAKKAPQPKLSDTFVAGNVSGDKVFFLVRGEVDRKQGQPAPGFLQVLMSAPETRWLPTPADKKASAVEPRVALAQWFTDADQGAGRLLARVIVNRLWQHHLGKGIVATPNDFGAQGEPPTHPELLDYLASELIKNGWQLKPIHKLIMTSAVYQQNGAANDAAQKVDPQNSLWWRRPAQRLEGEAIRDALLAVSGTLDATMHGAGTLDENSPRRSVYLTVKRSQLVPFLQMFDAPEAIQSIGVRSSTTVATQALAMMNSPLVRQRAEKLAARVRPKSMSGDALAVAVDDAYRTALGRRPADSERQRMLAFLDRQSASYAPSPRAADQALTDFCQLLLCLNEFIYVD